MSVQVSEEQAKQLLEGCLDTALEKMQSERDVRHFLKGVELKFKSVPFAKENRYLSQIPDLVSMVYDYIDGAYETISEDSIKIAFSGLVYFLSRNDLIDDNIPELGYIDDIAVLSYCVKTIEKDLNAYRKSTGRLLLKD